MDFLNKVPKPVLVLSIFLLGLVFIFYSNRPHTICDSQAENLKELQRGSLYPKKIKGVMTRPIYSKVIKECREGMGSPGACLEFFQILKRLVIDLETMDSTCGETINESLKQVRQAMGEGVLTFAQIAWGDSIPENESGKPKYSWLQPPELSLFCNIKDHWIRFYGIEGWDELRNKAYAQLSARKYETGPDGRLICKNCNELPSVVQALGSKDEVYKRSIFSLPCEKYR